MEWLTPRLDLCCTVFSCVHVVLLNCWRLARDYSAFRVRASELMGMFASPSPRRISIAVCHAPLYSWFKPRGGQKRWTHFSAMNVLHAIHADVTVGHFATQKHCGLCHEKLFDHDKFVLLRRCCFASHDVLEKCDWPCTESFWFATRCVTVKA